MKLRDLRRSDGWDLWDTWDLWVRPGRMAKPLLTGADMLSGANFVPKGQNEGSQAIHCLGHGREEIRPVGTV